MSTTAEYLLGSSQAEQERLRTHRQSFEAETTVLLDRVGIQPGWRAIDVGCGPHGILDFLSARVGPTGTVVGIDASESFVAQARCFGAERRLTNVEVVHGDARQTGLVRGSFDLVHARLVFNNVPEPEQVLEEMVALTRPGGKVAVQEIDFCSFPCEPAHPAWTRLLATFLDVTAQWRANMFLGRRTPALLRHAARAGPGRFLRQAV